MQLDASGAPAYSTSDQTQSRQPHGQTAQLHPLHLVSDPCPLCKCSRVPPWPTCSLSMLHVHCTAMSLVPRHAPSTSSPRPCFARPIHRRSKHTPQPLLAHPDLLPTARIHPHWCRLVARPSTPGTYSCASHKMHAMLACAHTCRIRVRSSSTWSTDRRRRRACPTSRQTPSGPLHPGDHCHEIYSHVH